MAKTFEELEPGDTLWYTTNLKDFSHPESATVKKIIELPDCPLFINVNIGHFDGDGRIGDKTTDYIFTAKKCRCSCDQFHTSYELAVKEMYKRWSDSKNDLENIKQQYNEKISEIQELIKNLKDKNPDIEL